LAVLLAGFLYLGGRQLEVMTRDYRLRQSVWQKQYWTWSNAWWGKRIPLEAAQYDDWSKWWPRRVYSTVVTGTIVDYAQKAGRWGFEPLQWFYVSPSGDRVRALLHGKEHDPAPTIERYNEEISEMKLDLHDPAEVREYAEFFMEVMTSLHWTGISIAGRREAEEFMKRYDCQKLLRPAQSHLREVFSDRRPPGGPPVAHVEQTGGGSGSAWEARAWFVNEAGDVFQFVVLFAKDGTIVDMSTVIVQDGQKARERCSGKTGAEEKHASPSEAAGA